MTDPAPSGPAATVYGLRGFDHAGGVLMTLMSADGATVLGARLRLLGGDGLRVACEPGRLPVCHEVRDGEFARLVAAIDVRLLDFAAWTMTKRTLGAQIYR